MIPFIKSQELFFFKIFFFKILPQPEQMGYPLRFIIQSDTVFKT